MKAVFFTDPHLGLHRAVGTTSKSRLLYQDVLFEQVEKVFANAKKSLSPVFCLGDVFDTFSNDEKTILQGSRLVEGCELTLAGNHDVSNKVGDVGSLKMLDELEDEYRQVIISPDPGKPFFEVRSTGSDTWLYAVPHCLTQEIFAESVRMACQKAGSGCGKAVLLLHCNVGDGIVGNVEDGGSSLWLTEELQELALEPFEKILVGHEHMPRQLHQGRLVVLGNTFPVSYGEIGPRFMYEMDLDTTELTAIEIFNPKLSYCELPVGLLLETEGDLVLEEVLLIQIVGQVKDTELALVAKAMMKLWNNNPQLISVKKSVDIIQSKSDKRQKISSARTLAELVNDAVTDAGYSDEFREICNE